MNYDEDFPEFVNFLRRNNLYNSMNYFGSNFSYPFNASFYENPISQIYFSFQNTCNELTRKIDEISDTLRDFSFSSSNSYKRRRLNNYRNEYNRGYGRHRHDNNYQDKYKKYHRRNRDRYGIEFNEDKEEDIRPHKSLGYNKSKNQNFSSGKNDQLQNNIKNINIYKNNINSDFKEKVRFNKNKEIIEIDDVVDSDSSEEVKEASEGKANQMISIYKRNPKSILKSPPLTKSEFYPTIDKEPKKKYLIVLDIYNLLYQRVTIDSVSSLIKINPSYKLKNAYIYLRPFLDTFLKELFNMKLDNDDNDDEEIGFEIAIWNTTKPFITMDIAELIFKDAPLDSSGAKKENYLKKLHFIWTIDQCELNESSDEEQPKFVRNIDTIINSKTSFEKNETIYPPVNQFDHWKKENIILITSLRPNILPPKSNFLCVPSYDVTNLQMEAKNDTSLLSLIQYLKNLLDLKPENVINYLNSNPFCVQKKGDFGIKKSLKINSLDEWDNDDYPNKIRQTSLYITQTNLEEMNIKFGNGRKKTNVIYKPVSSEPKNKYLIIFDLNGTLLHRLKNNSIIGPSTRKADFSINGKYVYLRPYLDSFIDALFNIDGEHRDKIESGFAVGAWTSAMLKNSELMLSQILKVDKRKKNKQLIFEDYFPRIFFKWARDFCTPILGTNFETEKNMDNLWNNKNDVYLKGSMYPAVNKFGHWNEKNTIIIDDSPHKSKKYPFNAIHVPTFEITNDDNKTETVLLSLIKYLKAMFYKNPSNVQEYLKKHPFSKISFDTTIESDDTLSLQEKFDKLKESTHIRVKSKWLLSGDEIDEYANGHSKFRESRLQNDLFNPSFKENVFPQQDVKFISGKKRYNENENSGSHKKKRKNNNKKNKKNKKKNVDDQLVDGHDNEAKNNDFDHTPEEKVTQSNEKPDSENENESELPSVDPTTEKNQSFTEKDTESTDNTMTADREEMSVNVEDQLSDTYEPPFTEDSMFMDDDTLDMLKEMQELTVAVKSTHPKKQDKKLFKRGIFY